MSEYTAEKISLLKNYLEKHPEYFCKENAVHTIDDVIYFKVHDPGLVVFVGDDFLCDIYGNELWIVRLLDKKKYDSRRHKLLKIEAIALVVKDCQSKFPTFNGYWKIPTLIKLCED